MSRLTKTRRAVKDMVSFVQTKRELPCRARCWGCCRGGIQLWEAEWQRLRPLVNGAALERLQAQGRDIDGDTALCPLLDPDTKLCTIYRERPLVCRAYVVVTPRDYCYPERVGTKEVHQVLEPLKEIISGMPELSDAAPTLRERLWSLVDKT